QRSKIDTSKSPDGKSATYHQSLTVTGFDSGYYVVEPMTFYYQQKGSTVRDSVLSEAFLVQIETVPVDTTKDIKDIKPPVEVPLNWVELLTRIAAGVAI